MRLIDADALKGRTTNFDEEGNRIWHKWDIDNAPTIMPKEFEPLVEAIIDVLPAIVEKTVPAIVEKIERPTGEWKVWEDERWGKEYYFCSKCNCQPYYEHSIYTLNFCPNCGAKMKGEEE